MKISNKQCFGLIVSISLLVMLVLNFLTPLFADDFVYSLKTDFNHNNPENAVNFNGHQTKLSEVFATLHNHYMYWGGRMLAHFFAMVFLVLDKAWFNVFNSIVYVLLTITIYFHVVRRGVFKPSLLLLINLLIFLLLPCFGQNVLWLTGACNYVWTMFFVLAFMLPYKFAIEGDKPQNKSFSVLKCLSMFLLGALAGMTNENVAMALLFIIVAFIFVYYKRHKNIPLWQIIGLLGALAGALFMILAPGNHERVINLEISDLNPDPESMPSLLTLLKRAAVYTFSKKIFFLLLLGLSSLYSILVLRKNRKDLQSMLTLIYSFGGFIAFYAMISSPFFPYRAVFGIVILMIIAMVSVFDKIKFDKIKFFKSSIITTCSLLVGYTLFTGTFDIIDTKKQLNERVALINSELERGNKNVEVVSVNPKSRINGGYLSEDAYDNIHGWTNKAMEYYYGLESIKGTNKYPWEWPHKLRPKRKK